MTASVPAYLAEAPSLGTTVVRMFEVYSDERHIGTWNSVKGDFEWTTYGDTYDEVRRLVAGLRAADVPKRTPIGIMLGNRREWLVADFAAAIHDCVVVGLHPAWSTDKLRTVLEESEVSVVFVDTDAACDAVTQLMAHTHVSRIIKLPPMSDRIHSNASTPPRRSGSPPAVSPVSIFQHAPVIRKADVVVEYASLLAVGEQRLNDVRGVSVVDDEMDVVAGRLGDCAATSTTDPVDDDDGVFTIMYSSGTSGVVKGIATPKSTWRATNCNPGPLASIATPSERRTVSYLSLAHGADRGVCWFTSMAGGSTGFITFPELSSGYFQQLRAIRPTFFLAMSCTWQDLYNSYYRKLMPRVEAALRARLGVPLTSADATDAAVTAGLGDRCFSNDSYGTTAGGGVDADRLAGVDDPVEQAWQAYKASDEYDGLVRAFLATRKGRELAGAAVGDIRRNLGDALLIAVTGGAATAPAVMEFVTRCLSDGNECRAVNSYGSTEFPGISSNGEVSSEVELRLDPVTLPNGDVRYAPPTSGEIVVRRRDGRTTRYWKRPDLTAKHWHAAGWYRTGDIGAMDADGKLRIVDRVLNVEEIYWQGDSVWIEPAHLESIFANSCPEVSSCIISADRNREGFVVIARMAHSKRVRHRPPTSATLLAAFTRAAAEHGLQDYERPLGVVIAKEVWTEQNGLLTISGKANRGMVKAFYADRVGLHYNDAEVGGVDGNGCVADSGSGGDAGSNGDDGNPAVAAAAERVRARGVVLLSALREEYDGDVYSLAQRHLAETTGCALPPEKKGSRKVDLHTTAPNGDVHWVETARGKDWLVGPEHLVFDNVAELDAGIPPPAPASTTDAVLECKLVAGGGGGDAGANEKTTVPAPAEIIACATSRTPKDGDRYVLAVNSIESWRDRRRRIAAWLKVPMERVRVSEEVAVVPSITAANDVEGGVTLRATVTVVADPSRYYPLRAAVAARLNEQFDRVRARALAIRERYAGWLEDHHARRALRQQEIDLAVTNVDVAVFLGHFRDVAAALPPPDAVAATEGAPHGDIVTQGVVDLITERLGLADGPRAAVRVLKALLKGKREVLRARVRLACEGLAPEAADAWNALDDELVQLRVLGDYLDVDTRALPVTWRMNVDWIVPPVGRETMQCIFGCGRFVYTEELEAHSNGFNGPCNPQIGVADDAASTPVGGDQSVECCVTGAMIDEECFETVTPKGGSLPYRTRRVRSLDSGVCRRPEYHALLVALWAALGRTRDTLREAGGDKWDHEEAARLHALLRLADRHPASADAWVADKQHPFWLHKHICTGKDIGKFDTPASLVARACDAFPHRLAFGIHPAGQDRPRLTHIWALPAAAGITPVTHREFLWLRYSGLWCLVSRVARQLADRFPRGSSVLIAGYNELEWVVADFACALAGMVSVGLHTTLDLPGAAVVAQHTKAVALFAMADLFARRPGPHNAWSVARLAAEAPALTVVACMDAALATVDTAMRAGGEVMQFSPEGAACIAAGEGRTIPLVSVLDWVGDDAVHADGSPVFISSSDALFDVRGGKWLGEDVTTILATSGSSGVPKLVAVGVDSFVADISGDMEERATVSESLTISYIPLSHSSDRYKLWQHAVLGGRVALCHYAAHHWSAHEMDKKEAMVEYASPVAQLFAQVSAAAPTSMSCPPNIWGGLRGMYLEGGVGTAHTHRDCNGDAAAAPPPQEPLKTFAQRTFGTRIKHVATGGSPTPSHVMTFAKDLCRHVNASFVDSYGATECGAILADGRLEGSKFENTRVLLLRRPDLGAACDDAARPVGEVAVQSPSIAVGYINADAAANAVFVTVGADGVFKHPQFPDVAQPRAAPGRWYITGDVAAYNKAERRYALVDRVGALVAVREGALVAPALIEAKLEQLPGVGQAFVHATPEHGCVGVVVTKPPPQQQEASAAATAFDDAIHAYPELEALLATPTWDAWWKAEVAPLLHGAPIALSCARTPWTVANGALSGELKKRRGVLKQRYAPELEEAMDALDDAQAEKSQMAV